MIEWTHLLETESVEATTLQKFLALGGAETFRVDFGRATWYRGTALNDVGPIERGDCVDLDLKEYAQYQEFKLKEDSI